MDDNEKRELKNLIEREVLTPLGMGYQPDDKKYPNFRVSKEMGPQWPDYEYLEWPHYSVTMQVVARPKPHLRVVKENKKMKITKAKLNQIIKEELSKIVNETPEGGLDPRQEVEAGWQLAIDNLAAMGPEKLLAQLADSTHWNTYIFASLALDQIGHTGQRPPPRGDIPGFEWSEELGKLVAA